MRWIIPAFRPRKKEPQANRMRLFSTKELLKSRDCKQSGETAVWGVAWSKTVATVLLLAVGSAQALTDIDSLRQRQDEQLEQLRQRQEVMPEVRLQAPVGTMPQRLPISESPCVEITSIRVESAGLRFDDAQLFGPDQNDSPLGRCVGARGMEILVARVQDALMADGHVTTRVIAATQDMVRGVLVLTVTPGRLGSVYLLSKNSMQPWSGPPLLVEPNEVVNLRDIEQSLENLQRTPGTEARVQLAPAEREGYSDLMVNYQIERPLSAHISLDDAGSEDTGRWQTNATLTWASPLGLADLLYVSLGADTNCKAGGPCGSGQRVLHYSVPWRHWLLAATFSDHRHHQALAGPWVSNLYRSEGTQHELKLARVVQRSMASKTSAHVKAFSRRSRNFINDEEVFPQRRSVGGWEAGFDHSHQMGKATVLASVNHRRGTGAFGSLKAPEERFGEGTSRMQLTLTNISLSTPMRWGDQVIHYQGQLRMQLNHTPLTPQDRHCIGGRYSVRGFDGVQSLCGDRGQTLRQELSWSRAGSVWQPYAALDMGRVSGTSATSRAALIGWALGMRAGWTRRPFAAQVDFFVGRPVRYPSDIETASSIAGISTSVAF